MCDPVSLTLGAIATGVGMSVVQDRQNKKAKKENNAAIQGINQAAQQQVEANKIANQTQSTEELQNPTLAQKLKEQKVPLNTSNTGATVGTPTSVGLNLGGY